MRLRRRSVQNSNAQKMEPVREPAIERCGRDVSCDEEGCKLRSFTTQCTAISLGCPSESCYLLQLRLRATSDKELSLGELCLLGGMERASARSTT